MEKRETELRYGPSTEFKKGFWYPLPVGFFERDQDEYIIDGYGVFKLQDDIEPDDKLFGDIDPAIAGTFTFSQALAICEFHNGEKLIK